MPFAHRVASRTVGGSVPAGDSHCRLWRIGRHVLALKLLDPVVPALPARRRPALAAGVRGRVPASGGASSRPCRPAMSCIA